MPNRLCTYGGCNAVVDHPAHSKQAARCPEHPFVLSYTPKRRYEHHYHNGKNIYKTRRWKRLRDGYIAQHPLCECDHCKLLQTPLVAELVDHVIEIEDGGEPYDEANLQSMAWGCHNRKTAKKAKERRKAGGFRSVGDF